MPNPLKPSEAHKQIIAQVLSEDVELRDMARSFVKQGFAEILDQLHRGDARTRAAIAKSLASVVTRAITDAEEDDMDGNLRAEMHQMLAEMREDMTPHTNGHIVPK